jgi:plastocyanin
MKKFASRIVIVVALALFLTACGGGGGSVSKTIDITITDFTFSPNSFSVPAGAQISFTGVNNGAVEHSFFIMKKGYQVQAHFTDADKANIFWGMDHIVPGQSFKNSFVAPSDPGEYQIVCGLQGHFEAGMIAKLIVVNP